LTVTLGSLPVMLLTTSCTAGMRVEPPTRMTSAMSLMSSLASRRDCYILKIQIQFKLKRRRKMGQSRSRCRILVLGVSGGLQGVCE
jgi:hypothetical protein